MTLSIVNFTLYTLHNALYSINKCFIFELTICIYLMLVIIYAVNTAEYYLNHLPNSVAGLRNPTVQRSNSNAP